MVESLISLCFIDAIKKIETQSGQSVKDCYVVIT